MNERIRRLVEESMEQIERDTQKEKGELKFRRINSAFDLALQGLENLADTLGQSLEMDLRGLEEYGAVEESYQIFREAVVRAYNENQGGSE